ncbi:isochorismate synthase [Actinomyces radicidentis]|uniref:isochorismate synthase n=1 Tax=Actinomyces radicidentis TaxID=111015 RepID=UPI003F65D103
MSAAPRARRTGLSRSTVSPVPLVTAFRPADAVAAHPPRLSFRTTPLPEGALALPQRGEDGELHGTPIPEDPATPLTLIDLLESHGDVASWVREGRGVVALGRTLEISARGEERIEELRAAWRATVYASWWEDPLVRPGTGPVALGTIAFSPASAERSALLVPRMLVGLDDEGGWITTAVAEGEEHPDPEALLPALVSTARLHRAAAERQETAEVSPGALSEEAWCEAVVETQRRMAEGEARKVVLARDVLVRPSRGLATGTVLGHLARHYPSCWTFAVDGMIGATPELLVRLEGRRLFSRVLAGTARRSGAADAVPASPSASPAGPDGTASPAPGASPTGEEAAPTTDVLEDLAAWLTGSEKNREEHELARASAVRALDPLCSVVEAPEPFVLTLPNVLHLATDVTGVVAGDTGALSLVRALHPTAAVCGAPTPSAARIIEEVEGMDRGRYAGPVGWVDWHGEGEWGIALRSARLRATALGPSSPARVFGGGGIMPGSDPRDELAETRAKMRPVLEALGAAEG